MSHADSTFNPGERVLDPCELPEGQTRLMKMAYDDRDEEVILTHIACGFRAYVNRCRHLPISLDWGDGEVLDQSGEHFLCRNHGALFRTIDGLCVSGPCQGLTLLPVAIEEHPDGIYLAKVQPVRF